jgi:probable HAF family extracellular repeat protein
MAVNNAEVVVAQNGVGMDSAVALLPEPGETWGYVGLEGAEADGSGWRNVLGLNDQFGVSLLGVAVGQAASSDYGSAKVACYWDSQFDCHVIGRLGASGESQANAANSAGQIVGASQSGGSPYEGFVYFDGVMENVNDLLVPGSPAITIEELHDVNTAGWMVGRASTGAVLLRPRYLDDRDFQLNDLTVHWTVNGSARTQETEPGEYCAVLTAESPTSISQEIATPVADFRLEFDYRFLTNDPTAVLTVELEGTSLAELHPPDPAMSSWDSHGVLVTDPALQNLDAATLSFIYDGPAGSELLLDNIGINQVPEPSALALQGLALLGLAFFRCRRKR